MRAVDADLWIVGDACQRPRRFGFGGDGDGVRRPLSASVPRLSRRRARLTRGRHLHPASPRACAIGDRGDDDGLPVVLTNIRGTREEVVEGETDTLVPRGRPRASARRLIARP